MHSIGLFKITPRLRSWREVGTIMILTHLNEFSQIKKNMLNLDP